MRWKELLEKKPHAWVKWGVIAACLCIVIAGFFVIRHRAAALPVEQVENPVFVSREEGPVMQRDDLKNMLVNNIVVWGTVQDCSYLRIRVGDSVWYLTTMRVAVDTVIRRGSGCADDRHRLRRMLYGGTCPGRRISRPARYRGLHSGDGRDLCGQPGAGGRCMGHRRPEHGCPRIWRLYLPHPLQPAGGQHRL